MLRTVLLLDDDAYFHRIVTPALIAQEVSLLHAYNLAEADSILADQRVDAIVADSHLPDGDGEAWIIGRRNRGDQTPVLFVSADGRVQDMLRRRMDALEPIVLATKPIVPTLFAAQVRSLFGSTGKSGQMLRPPWLDELRRDYQERLPDMVRSLRSSIEKARVSSEGPASQAFADAKKHAHSFRGTAGSYGFFRVSEAAGRLEDALAEVVSTSPQSPKSAWDHVESALGSMVHAASIEAPLEALPAQESTPTAVGTRMLVVSADRAFRDEVAEAGRRQLIEVTGAPSPSAALSLVRASRFDGAVVDAPADSSEVASLVTGLRTVAGHEHLPIAFVSAESSLRARVEAVQAGATLYLKRPLDIDTLCNTLRDLVTETTDVRPRALIVDADPAFGAAVVELLRKSGIDARALADARAALHAVDYYRPDILLLDIVMPVIGGLDLCRVLRATPACRTLPILLVSSKVDVETRIQAFEAGADDHISKPLVHKELLARVRGRLERQRLLRDRAERDSLTGLLLRGPVVDALQAKLADAQRRRSVLSVALLDLDGFKSVNDTFGHLAGDRVLVTLGRLLATRFRAEDVRGRWGGEEFLIAFPGEPSEVAEGLVLRVLRELRETQFTGDQGQAFHITFSAGVATYPEDGLTVEALLRTADRRLYRAKHTGKNRVLHEDGLTDPPRAA